MLYQVDYVLICIASVTEIFRELDCRESGSHILVIAFLFLVQIIARSSISSHCSWRYVERLVIFLFTEMRSKIPLKINILHARQFCCGISLKLFASWKTLL